MGEREDVWLHLYRVDNNTISVTSSFYGACALTPSRSVRIILTAVNSRLVKITAYE